MAAGYDIFTQIQGPAIPISLYADAATAGINAGNAMPTKTQSIIEGAIKGIQTGQQIQSNQLGIEAQGQQNIIRQNQIEQLPVTNRGQELGVEAQAQQNVITQNQIQQLPLTNRGQAATVQAIEQQNTLRQNEIGQLPVANELQRLQMETQRKVDEINRLKLEQDRATQQAKLDAELTRLREDKAKLDEELRIRSVKQSIADDLASNDPAKIRAILQDGQKAGVVYGDSKYAESILGDMVSRIDPNTGQPIFSPEERKQFFDRANFTRSMELESLERQTKARELERTAEELIKVKEDAKKDSEVGAMLAGAGVGDISDLLGSKLEVLPEGIVTYKKDKNGKETNEEDTSVPRDYSANRGTGKPQAWDVIIDGKRAPSSLTNSTSVSRLKDYYNKARAVYGYDQREAALKEQQTDQNIQQPTEQTPTSKPRIPKSREDITASLKDLPEDITKGVLDKAEQKGYSENFVERAISNAVPSAFLPDFRAGPGSSSITSNPDLVGPRDKAREAIRDTASKLAQETLDKFETASPEAKEALRDLARVNNFALNKNGLTNYYKDLLGSELNKAYEEALFTGRSRRADAARQERMRIDAAAGLARKRPDRLLERDTIRQSAPTASNKVTPEPSDTSDSFAYDAAYGEPTMPEDSMFQRTAYSSEQVLAKLDSKTESLMTRYNIPSEKAREMKDDVRRVENNHYAQGQPPHVKAVMAVESRGRTKAISNTNVQGLMQVTKPVAAMYGLNRNIPEENVKAGSLYLDDLIKQFKGSKPLAYAAYNAGPGVIAYAQKLAGGSSDWNEVKKYLYRALKRYEGSIGVSAEDKLKEVQNYPERVMLYEYLFENSTLPQGVV